MNRNVAIATAVGIAVIVGAIGFQLYESSYQRSTVEEYYADQDHDDDDNIKHVVYPPIPQRLHGLTITKDKYLLGENVFMSIQGIPMGLKDSIQVFTPNEVGYFELAFDGDEKTSFKHYFRPSLQKSLDLCEKEDLIGEWTILFAGLPEDKLHFEIVGEILPGSESYYEDCNRESQVLFPNLDSELDD